MLMGIHSLTAYLQLQVVWVYITTTVLDNNAEIFCKKKNDNLVDSRFFILRIYTRTYSSHRKEVLERGCC
ncbi:hypothetical protein FG071_05770 [Vibrio cholerae]|nr:hypothetical protein [Vibrio cholerae]